MAAEKRGLIPGLDCHKAVRTLVVGGLQFRVMLSLLRGGMSSDTPQD